MSTSNGLLARQLDAIGERVRALRASRGWSQRDVARRTGMGRAKVSAIELGKQNLTLEGLWRLADLFQVHWADLADDRVANPPPHRSVPFDQQLRAFGTRTYQARVLQRLSQQALNDRTQIGRSAVAEVETGTQNITLETLSRLAAGLGVHWAQLLDDRHDAPPQPDRARSGSDGSVSDMADQDERDHQLDLQQAADALAAAFDRDDRPRLAELSTVQLRGHVFARRLLADYLDQAWDDTQPAGSNPTEKPACTGIAALRHLTHQLLTAARDEQTVRDRGQHRRRRTGAS